MRYFYDLHVHSCLSPCADLEMTPNNIANMAYIKDLDILAVSDHNSAKNLDAVNAICRQRGILLIPALEAESHEEVHVLCYMPSISAAQTLGDLLYASLPDLPFDPAFFGDQVIMNEDDLPIGSLDRLLIQSSSLTIEELFASCRDLGGVPVPAHINKDANSILTSLGFIPPELNVKTVEMHCAAAEPPGLDLDSLKILRSSDAHMLEAISERRNSIALEEKSIPCFLDALKRGRLPV